MKRWLRRWRRSEQATMTARLFEVDQAELEEGHRIDLAAFLIKEKGWPATAFTVHAVGLFADAVKRRYEQARGYEPPRDGLGAIYVGFTDYLIVADTFDDEMPAIEEQLEFEGRGRRSQGVSPRPAHLRWTS